MVLAENRWLDLSGMGVQSRRPRRLSALLNGGRFELYTHDWIVVHEAQADNPNLDRLRFRQRFLPDYTFGGNVGFDFYVYTPPPLPPPTEGIEFEVGPGARPFLGSAWRLRAGETSVEVPPDGASLFLPPVAGEKLHVRVAVSANSDDEDLDDFAITVELGQRSLALTRTRGALSNQDLYAATLDAPGMTSKITEIRITPVGDGPVRFEGFSLRRCRSPSC